MLPVIVVTAKQVEAVEETADNECPQNIYALRLTQRVGSPRVVGLANAPVGTVAKPIPGSESNDGRYRYRGISSDQQYRQGGQESLDDESFSLCLERSRAPVDFFDCRLGQFVAVVRCSAFTCAGLSEHDRDPRAARPADHGYVEVRHQTSNFDQLNMGKVLALAQDLASVRATATAPADRIACLLGAQNVRHASRVLGCSPGHRS